MTDKTIENTSEANILYLKPVPKISKEETMPLRQCCFYLKIQKQQNKRRVHHILKVHPVNSLAPLISGRKERFLSFLTIHHGMYGSILDFIQNRSRHAFA